MKAINTFSIVAYDPTRKEWGVAVQSKFLAVGAVVPWVKAGVGAVATQSYANICYGNDGLQMLSEGLEAKEVVSRLTQADKDREKRQLGIVDQNGNSAAFTGSECHSWAGHVTGEFYCCQGNMLIEGTVQAMADRFEQARKGEGELADWLVDALQAGQEAGGDKRGKQAACVIVKRENGGYGANNEHYLDLRVDDFPDPIRELKRLVEMHHLYFKESEPEDMIPLKGKVVSEIQDLIGVALSKTVPKSACLDDTTAHLLEELVGMENLEERWNGDREKIDRCVVDFLKSKYGKQS